MNRLADATSPYLLQHKDNPVDWWEWGDDAFAEARRREVPIFLSVGYAACHWCHVMAHESFSDEATASMINETFVPIKVDREERPDVDAVYMNITQVMTGQGGWPMSVFLTPSGEPFHAGTYFPPRPGNGMPSFSQVLEAVSEAWTQRRAEVEAGATRIVDHLRENAPVPTGGAVDPAAGLTALASGFDATNGGFGTAPKFPPSMVLEALLRAAEQPGRYPDAWPMAEQTLLAMARGGIYDQLAGGFARYSVDSRWVVPHFEKMLYDNALLLGVYARAAALAARLGQEAGELEAVVTEMIEWLLAEMLTAQGAFAASLDADSLDADGVLREGAYYAWNQDQLCDVLGTQDGQLAATLFGVTASGTFERGASTLQRPGGDHSDRLVDLRSRLHAARGARPRPARDDKVIAAWNGWLVDSLTYAAMIFGRSDWLELAESVTTMIKDVHWRDGRLRRTSRDGAPAPAEGMAEDYAAMALAAARLATATGDVSMLTWAGELLDVLRTDFGADDGGVHDTSTSAQPLIIRPRDLTDNATPSGTSASVLAARLVALVTGDRELDVWADGVAATQSVLVNQAPRFAGWPLADAISRAASADGAGPVELAIAHGDDGTDDPVRAGDLVRAGWRCAPAGSVVVSGLPDAPGWELLAGRPLVGRRATGYVCRDFACRLPVTEVDALVAALAPVDGTPGSPPAS